MKYIHRCVAAFGALLPVVFCLSCASRPDEAIKLAQTAMDEAKQVQASDLAPGDWKVAQKAWDDAQEALSKQQYPRAASLLATAKSRFGKAQAIAKANGEAVGKEVNALQNTVNKRLTSLRSSLATTRASSRTMADLKQICQEAESASSKFNDEVLGGQLIKARASGQAALQKLQAAEKLLLSASKRPTI